MATKTRVTVKGRVCTKCFKWKPWSKYTPRKETVTGHFSWCKQCFNKGRRPRTTQERVVAAEYAREYRRDHPYYNRNYMYAWRYGITRKQALKLLRGQGYRCAICRKKLRVRNESEWHVDHDHQTHKVRGVLCNCCNTGLGKLGDTAKKLKRAVDYLERC